MCGRAEKAQTLQTELSTCQAALQITRKDMEEKLTLSSAEIHSQRLVFIVMAGYSGCQYSIFLGFTLVFANLACYVLLSKYC